MTGTTDSSTTSGTEDVSPKSTDDEVVLETRPTVKPPAILLSLVLFVGFVLVLFLWNSPFVFLDDGTINQILMGAVGVLTLVVSIRLVIDIIVLRRTTYRIRTESLERETDMIFRYTTRKAPVAQLRGFEYSQNVIQLLLGVGSIQLLTAGTNQSLGFIVFENLPNAGSAKEHLERLIK